MNEILMCAEMPEGHGKQMIYRLKDQSKRLPNTLRDAKDVKWI